MLLQTLSKQQCKANPNMFQNGQGRAAAHLYITASGTHIKPHLVCTRQTLPTVHEAHVHIRVQQCTWRDHSLVEGLIMYITQCPARTISN